MVNWTGVARRTMSSGSKGKGGGSTFPKGAGMAVVCGIATVIALPSIGYSHGEADATARMGPQARVVYVPPAAAPDAYLCSASCAPKQAPDLSADEHRAMAAYWKSQTVKVKAPKTTTSSGAVSQSTASGPSRSVTVTQTQSTSTTAKGTTTTKNSTSTKTTTKG